MNALGPGFRSSLHDALSRLPTPEAKRSVSVFRHGTLEAKLYAPRGTDPQQPHTRDEVYVVAQGSGRFVCDGHETPFEAGDFLFVPAGVAHRFEEFTDDLAVWVLFYGSEDGEAANERRGVAGGVSEAESA